MTARRVGLRLSAVVLSTALAILIGELGMRVAGLGDPVDGSDVIRAYAPADPFEPDADPEIGHRLRANYAGEQVYTSSTTGIVVHRATTHTDARGLRAESTRTEGRVVVAVGDSTTFGVGVADGESWPAALERRLATSWRVVNAGVPGRNTAQEVRWFGQEARSLHPDVAVLAFYINDLAPAIPVSGQLGDVVMPSPTWASREGGLRRISRIYNLGWRTYERRTLAAAVSGDGLSYVEALVQGGRVEDLYREFERFAKTCREVGARSAIALLPVLDVADPRAADPLLAKAEAAAVSLGVPVLHAEHSLDDFDIPERIVLPAERHASVKANARIAAVLHDELRRVGLL